MCGKKMSNLSEWKRGHESMWINADICQALGCQPWAYFNEGGSNYDKPTVKMERNTTNCHAKN